MKRLLLLITALFLLASVEGQILRYSNYVAPAEPSGDYNFQVDRYISGLSTPLNDSVTEKINTLVVALCDSLNIDSLAQVFDVFYVLANGNSEAALRNLVKRSHDATNVNTMTFTAFEGFAGNGTTSYLNTNYNPSSDGVNYTLNSASMSVYDRTGGTHEGSLLGCNDGTNFIYIRPYANASFGIFGLNALGGAALAPTPITTATLYTVSRTSSSLIAAYNYKSSLASSSSSNSSAIPNLDLHIATQNGYASFSTRQISVVYVAAGLTKDQSDDIADVIEVYMDSNGKGVL